MSSKFEVQSLKFKVVNVFLNTIINPKNHLGLVSKYYIYPLKQTHVERRK